MNAHAHHEPQAGNKQNKRKQDTRAIFLARVIKTLIGALIGTALTSLFSIVIFAFVIKAFITSEAMSFQLLNSAITLVGSALGAALGYFLGRNSHNDPGEED